MTSEDEMNLKNIPGIDNRYFVSDSGHVYSIGPERNSKRNNKFRQLKPFKKNNGYLSIALKHGNKTKKHHVHRLILMAFCSNDNEKRTECNHKNGIKDDNRLENLEWVSKSENMIHAVNVLGKKNRKGMDSYSRKINDDTVKRIRELRSTGLSYSKIGAVVGLEESWVWRISNRKAWGHVE